MARIAGEDQAPRGSANQQVPPGQIVCDENTCQHAYCLTWWQTQVLKAIWVLLERMTK